MTALAFRPNGPAPAFSLAPTLAQIVGYAAANFNMIDAPTGLFTAGAFGPNAPTPWIDFSSTLKWDRVTNLTFTSGRPSPDGAANAQKVTPTVTNGNHNVFSTVVNSILFSRNTPIPFRLAMIAKPNGYSRIVLDLNPQAGVASSDASVGFDIAGGNTNYDNSAQANITIVQAVITAIAGGWYLCYFDFALNSNVAFGTSNIMWSPTLYIDNGTGTAARSISFAGDAVKGVDVWWFSLLPVQAWSLTNQTWFEDFNNAPSVVDEQNTLAPGFKYYVDFNWPASPYFASSFWGGPVDTSNPINPACFAQQSSAIVLQPHAGTAGGMWSISSGTHGRTVTGTAFRGAQIKECLRADSVDTPLNAHFGGVAFWGASLETLTNKGLNPLNPNRYLEWNVTTDAGYLLNNGNTFAWALPGGVPSNANNSSSPNRELGSASILQVIAPNVVSNRWASMWIPASHTGTGWGMFHFFLNGISYGNGFFYSLGGDPGGFNAFQNLCPMDNHQIVILHTQDAHGTTVIDYDAIWQLASPITAYTFWDIFGQGPDLLVDNNTKPGLGLTKPSGGGGTWETVRSSVGKTAASGGKWYWELTLGGGSIGATTGVILGLVDANATINTSFPGGTANGAGLQYNTAANTNVNGVTGNSATVITWAAADVIGFAFDPVAGKVWIHKNGTYLASMAPDTSTGIWSGLTSGTWYAAAAMNTAANSNSITANFGQTSFAFTAPSGYTGWTQVQQ